LKTRFHKLQYVHMLYTCYEFFYQGHRFETFACKHEALLPLSRSHFVPSVIIQSHLGHLELIFFANKFWPIRIWEELRGLMGQKLYVLPFFLLRNLGYTVIVLSIIFLAINFCETDNSSITSYRAMEVTAEKKD